MSSDTPVENLEKLRFPLQSHGIGLLSSARIDDRQRARFHDSIRGIASSLECALVFGIRLSSPVLETVKTAPTWTYYHHYRAVNFALDQAVLLLVNECHRMGYRALPIPASQIMDWERLEGHLSHRELGALAGLGWRGRNNLLINQRYGSQVRYASVLTNMPLPERAILGSPDDCGDCMSCIRSCPVGAIHEDPHDFDLDRCVAQIRRFSKQEKLNALICGLCVRACSGQAVRTEANGGGV